MDTNKLQSILIIDGSTKDIVLSQLKRILSSSYFRLSPQLGRFLSFVVESVLSGQVHQIKQYTIAVDAFGYREDFDPQMNPAMRVLASRLRKMLKQYYLHDGVDDEVLIEIPKRTYIPIFRTNLTVQTQNQSGSTKTLSQFSVPDYGLSVAVIPFSSQIPDNNICADEITDSIIMGLAKFREMRIIGPLVRYQNRFVDVEEIGRRYYVRFVLQGRVQIQGDKLRVTVGLTDSHTGYNIWSQTYEYLQAATNLLDAEDNVSRRIVNALADYMGIIPSLIIRESKKKDPEGLEVHEAILSQKHYLKVFETQSYLAAVEALEHAVKVDPDHPIALATLGNAYCHNHLFDMRLLSATLEDAERLVQRAIAFDSECQMAHFTEGIMRYLQGQSDQCIEKLHLTISLNNLDAYFMYGSAVMTCMVGYWKEGAALFEQARKLNSQHPPFYFVLPFMDHYRKGEYQEAWNYALRFNTSIYVDPLIRAAAAGQLGLKDQAEIALQELLDMKPDFPSHPQDLLRRCFFLDEHVEMLLEGLLKAGLKLEVSKN